MRSPNPLQKLIRDLVIYYDKAPIITTIIVCVSMLVTVPPLLASVIKYYQSTPEVIETAVVPEGQCLTAPTPESTTIIEQLEFEEWKAVLVERHNNCIFMEDGFTDLHYFILRWESCRSGKYTDAGGYTIGVGHHMSKSERKVGGVMINYDYVNVANGLDKYAVRTLLDQDIEIAAAAIDSLVKVPLETHQRHALTSWVFNVGVSAASTSTLIRRLNKGKYNEVPIQLRRWHMSQGKLHQGLVKRREAEINLWHGVGYAR